MCGRTKKEVCGRKKGSCVERRRVVGLEREKGEGRGREEISTNSKKGFIVRWSECRRGFAAQTLLVLIGLFITFSYQ